MTLKAQLVTAEPSFWLMPKLQLQVPPPQVRFISLMVHWFLDSSVSRSLKRSVCEYTYVVAIMLTSASAAGAANAEVAERTARMAEALNFILDVVG